ncbi:zincin-like metallopeptidase domain-containing protein [Novosphingobium sp. KCTC 2891]|uniref:zincin-like metallopeptidase domain-containing protein n=1 Tax=Novosphingobium sp. KCTC 2891 TaxID=2989730 RepID=UPI0039B696DB
MKQVRKNGAGIHISAGLSGYIASLCQATLCAEYGLPNELHDSHASYIHHWMKILRGDKTAILHAAAKAEQAVKWLRQFDPALGSTLPDELKEAA